MSKFLFLFGNTPQLSLLELNTVYPDLTVRHLAGGELAGRLALVELDKQEFEQANFMQHLAGVVKIFEVEKILNFSISLSELKNEIVASLLAKSQQPDFSNYQKG
jgi:hypothetical protein